MRPVLAGCLLLGQVAPVHAYPDRPVTVVIPFPSTGSTDIAGIPRISKLFRAMSGAHIVHVNYNGSLPALNAIMTSQVELGFVPLAAALPYRDGGKVRIIAVTNSTRHPLVPAVPTIAESGIDGFDASGWFGVFAPARTPGAIVSLLNYEINRALSEELLQRTLISQGLLPAPGTAEDFRALVEKDRGRWTRLLKTVGTTDKRR